MSQEIIKFSFHFRSEYWDKPPMIAIQLDKQEQFRGEITATNNVIEFQKPLTFGKHTLSIDRYNKSNSQTKIMPDGSVKDQLLILEKVIIDGIDIKDIVNHYSYTKPSYPEPWASLEKRKGNVLPEYVRGETCWGHNLTWTLKFTSPFYLYVMNWMRGSLNEHIF